jgi:2-(1,2-epoxy-1,2-dihydrophenyl)acetyl-CoA isomerase
MRVNAAVVTIRMIRRYEVSPIIEIERDGSVCTITLNRPDVRNALNLALLLQLRKAVHAATHDAAVRCLVITGRDGAFCAGADIAEWNAIVAGNSPYPDHDWVEEATKLVLDIAQCPKPTIAMIDGAAAGAGLDIALACDFRIASERARFICSYTHIGYTPDCGGTWFLPRLIGIEAAKAFIFTGDIWNAHKALETGLVGEVAPTGQLQDRTFDLAQGLARGPTIAIGLAKHLIEQSLGRTLVEQQLAEQVAGRICSTTQDHHEGLEAATQRREPRFNGA